MSEIVLCCVCLMETDDSVLDLFEKCAKNETFLWKILFDVVGVGDVDTFGLKDDMITSASKICLPCSGQLTKSYEYQKLCQKNWDKLMSMTNGRLFYSTMARSVECRFVSISEFICKEEQEPPDALFKFKCYHCESSFSKFIVKHCLCMVTD